MTYRDDIELNTYIKNEWNSDGNWLRASSSTRRCRTRIECEKVIMYKLSNVLRGILEAVLPAPCCQGGA